MAGFAGLPNSQHHSEPTPTAAPTRYLVVETGRDCSMEQQEQANGHYTLRATIGNETVLFSTHTSPATIDVLPSIRAAVGPDVEIIMVGGVQPGVFCGPLIVVLSRPRMVGSSCNIIENTMTQSASQGEVVSIEQFLEMSWVSCSIFIDSAPPANGIDWVT